MKILKIGGISSNIDSKIKKACLEQLKKNDLNININVNQINQKELLLKVINKRKN